MSQTHFLRVQPSGAEPTYTPPTVVQVYPGTFSATGATQTQIISVLVGDLIVVMSASPDDGQTLNLPTATANTFVNQNQVQVASYTEVGIWTATATATNASLTISQGVAGGLGLPWGFDVFVIRNWDGFGITQKANVASGAPSLNMNLRRAKSLVILGISDWAGNDGSSRAWRTLVGGTSLITETHYYRDAAQYTTYGGYYADAKVLGPKDVGISSPGQKYSIVALEVFGKVATSGPLAAYVGSTPVLKFYLGNTEITFR